MITERAAGRRAAFLIALLAFALSLAGVYYSGGISVVEKLREPEAHDTVVSHVTVEAAPYRENICMGVPVAEQAVPEALGEYAYTNYGPYLRFAGLPMALDLETSTLYVTQPITDETSIFDLTGEITLEKEGCRLMIAAETTSAKKLSDSNTPLQLIVADEQRHTYMKYKLMLSTLPVISMEGRVLELDEENRHVLAGRLTLTNPKDEAGDYVMTCVNVEWNIRGKHTKTQAKNAWKVNLVDNHRREVKTDFLGLGRDDDWILNCLVMDDTAVREKLTMDMWNDMAEQTAYNYPMSTGEYVELVINNQYRGLYLLQRQVDEDYLELDRQTMLLKGLKLLWYPQHVSKMYEIKHSYMTDVSTYTVMEPWMELSDCSTVVVDNFVDVQLFLNWGYMPDNAYYFNIYHLLVSQDDGYRMYLIPWDTDMSLGAKFDGVKNDFVIDVEYTAQQLLFRREYDAVKQYYPDLDQRVARRWFELRESMYDVDTICGRIEAYYSEIGPAVDRNLAYWGEKYNGDDTVENLRKYLVLRMEFLDSYYAQFLEQ